MSAECESDITTSPETEDIVEKKVRRRQLCGRGLDTAKMKRSRQSRSAKYAGGRYQPGRETPQTFAII